MAASASRILEAWQIWDWLQWRLSPAQWLEAQQVIHGPQPTPTDPVLAAGLTEILNPATTNARRLELVQDLLRVLAQGGPRH